MLRKVNFISRNQSEPRVKKGGKEMKLQRKRGKVFEANREDKVTIE